MFRGVPKFVLTQGAILPKSGPAYSIHVLWCDSHIWDTNRFVRTTSKIA